MLILGLTGSLGSGKTTVAAMLTKLGARHIDADRIYHQLIKRGYPLYKELVAVFGQEILKQNQQIDRKKLGKIAFENKKHLKRLCQITHPAVIKEIKSELSKLKKLKREKIVLIDAPLLIEANLIKIIDKLIVVTAGRKKQIARSRVRLKIPYAQILQRMKAQVPLKAKIRLADYVIDNDGTLKQTRKQVKNIWKQM